FATVIGPTPVVREISAFDFPSDFIFRIWSIISGATPRPPAFLPFPAFGFAALFGFAAAVFPAAPLTYFATVRGLTPVVRAISALVLPSALRLLIRSMVSGERPRGPRA